MTSSAIVYRLFLFRLHSSFSSRLIRGVDRGMGDAYTPRILEGGWCVQSSPSPLFRGSKMFVNNTYLDLYIFKNGLLRILGLNVSLK